MNVVGQVNMTNCNYQVGYDLLSQNIAGNYSTVRFYGVLNVNGYVSWSRGTASVWDTSVNLATRYSGGSHTLITIDRTIYHDSNGNYSGTLSGTLSTTYVSGTASGVFSLPSISRYATITNSPSSFTDEDNPWIDFNNPANSSMSVWLEPNPNGQHFAIRNISGTGGRYTWDLTDDERTQLRNSCKNANSCVIRLGLYSTIGGSTNASYHDRTYKIINANPEFNDFTFKDINPDTIALTGDDQVNVNGYSNIKVTIPVENKAVAKKSATMSKYRLSIGTGTTDILYSDTEDVTGTISKSESGTYNLYATDSRNNSTLVTKLAKSVIEYTPVNVNSVNASATRNNSGVGEQCIVSFDGTFWNKSFGAVTNHLDNISYKFKKTTSSEWINGTSKIEVTVNEDKFSFSGKLKSDNENPDEWNIEESYNIQILISDTLSTSTLNLILNSGVPTIALAKGGVGIMGKYEDEIGGFLQVDGKKMLFPYILYNNDSGTTGTITLSDNADNYDCLEIYYLSTSDSTTGYAQNSTKIYNIGDKTNFLITGYLGTSSFNLKVALIGISGNQITKQYGAYEFNDNMHSSSNYIGITKVIGYR